MQQQRVRAGPIQKTDRTIDQNAIGKLILIKHADPYDVEPRQGRQARREDAVQIYAVGTPEKRQF